MAKNIITCSDGTWNKPDEQEDGVVCPTNVYKFYKSIGDNNDDGNIQLSFYDEGVGTGRSIFSRLFGGAFGAGLNKNIKDAYRFICRNYEPGDRLYLLGFSRGAYTARSLAGLIRNSGILKKEYTGSDENDPNDRVNEAFTLYRDRDDKNKPDEERPVQYRSQYAVENVTPIHFIGVWDTVGSLGIPLHWFDHFNRDTLKLVFHDVQLSSFVNHAFHALAIDEKREMFEPTLWKQSKEILKKNPGQVLEQVWFTGVHSNVGGGYPDTGLSDLALNWMATKAAGCGLNINHNYLNSILKPDYKGILVNSKTGFYKLFKDFDRSIGSLENGSEKIKAEAIRRLDDRAKAYNPVNLERAYKSGVPVTEL